MGQSDLFTSIGLPPMNAEQLGVQPPPVAAPPPQVGPAPNMTKPFSLALLAGALAGGRDVGGPLISGVLGAHQQKVQQHQRDTALAQQEQLKQQQIQAQQQQQYQAQAQRREQEFGAIINGPHGFYEAVSGAKTPADYDAQVQQYASLLQTRGFRVDANQLRAMAPFTVPSDEKKANELVDKLLKNPLNEQLLKTNPEKFLAGQVQFQSGGDKTPRQYPISQLFALAGRSVVMDDQGKPIIPDQADGKIGTAFQEALGAARMAFKAQYNREPNPKEQQQLVERAIETTKEKPVSEVGGTLPPRLQTRVDSIAKGFDSQAIVKTTQKMAEAVSFASSLDPNTTNPADDQALIYAFAKAMDPDSVVREGEYATVQKYAQSWAQTFGFNAARVFSNTAFLTPQARANMKQTIQKKYQAGKAQYDNVRKSYVNKINKTTGHADGEDYLIDYAGGFPDGGPAQTPTAAPADGAVEEWVRDPKTGKLMRAQ